MAFANIEDAVYNCPRIEEIQVCLESFFTVCWWRHYERRQPIKDVSLFDLYNETWGKWYEKRVKKFSTQDILANEL